jgi:DNA-binding IclR family transcriptional regulator
MHVYFTRQGIAEEIGIKPSGLSTVTRALAKMKARGIVKKVGATHWIVNPRLFWIGNTASCETAYAAFCVMKEVGDKDT